VAAAGGGPMAGVLLLTTSRSALGQEGAPLSTWQP